MNASGRDGLMAWSPLFFSIVLILGMVLGFNLRDSLRNKRDIASVIERNDRLEQVIDLINEKYVDSVNSNRLYQDAIEGILKSLDPHTVYIPTEETQEAHEELEGEFSGIGVEFSIVDDTVAVTAVLDDGPAAQAGLKVGDQLISVNDTIVAGKGITSTRIMHMLRGEEKSKLRVALRHNGSAKLQTLNLTRGLVPIPSVEVGLMVDNHTGYIKINRFSATVYEEFKTKLTELKKEGAEQLIIDLRDNPGGYLDQVVSIADELLNDNKLIVYTQGSHTARISYNASKQGLFEQGKLAVLINESSASASEILAGAVQDWDRGMILGRRSFGKGLVQEPYEMTDGSEIRLTVAKYYTPSGRCIQRSFANGKAAYATVYEQRLLSDAPMMDDEYPQGDTTKFYTSNKRIVYGGGGISPDLLVATDTEKLAPLAHSRLYSNELRNAIWRYYLHNRTKLQYKSAIEYNSGFRDENEILYQYVMSMDASNRKELMRALTRSSVLYRFNAYIKAQMGRYLFQNKGYYVVTLQDDVAVRKAKELFNSSTYSDAITRK
jgi:carboxyl-terminal processing protease